jgi:hypothetical protein
MQYTAKSSAAAAAASLKVLFFYNKHKKNDERKKGKKKKLNKAFMFQGMCVEARVLHKKKKRREKEKRERNDCEFLNQYNIFFFDTISNQIKQSISY